jgi:anti-anti-sigma factor
MDAFSIKVEKCDIDDAVIVKPVGSIDSTTTHAVEKRLIHIIDNGIKYLIMDFSKTTFISSSGVGVLLGLVSSLREDNGDLVLMNVSDRINDIFDILNINDYFVTIENVDQLREHIPAR